MVQTGFRCRHQDLYICYQHDFQHLLITYIVMITYGYVYQSGITRFFKKVKIIRGGPVFQAKSTMEPLMLVIKYLTNERCYD
jgi:hypothetical protein